LELLRWCCTIAVDMVYCSGCRKRISGHYIEALGRAWHAECFRCAACGKPFRQGRYAERDGKPYHADCYRRQFGPRCAGCGEPIEGEAVSALGKVWHPEHFLCTACKRPFDDAGYVIHRGRPYHEACYRERFAPRCAGCGEPILGQGVKALGRHWHAEHFVCAHCGRPLSGGAFCERGGQPYCEEDYRALFGPRCSVCGETLPAAYVTNPWGDTFCAHHQGEIPECHSCGRLASQQLTGGYVRYPDGRVICHLCLRSAVEDRGEAQGIMETVRRTLAHEGLDLGDVPLRVRLTDQHELDRLAGRSHRKHPAGMARTQLTTRGDKTVKREVLEILALHGLPREHLASILAHELAHAWLFLHAFPKLSPKVAEGICELASYLWLRTQDGAHAAYRIHVLEKNKDRVYGTGFRAARRVLRKHSLAWLLAFVKRYGRFPKGA
jgi:hypothetical protein